ncbi:MAG: hypothetical protein J6031_01520 [Bacteroidales bacterium]|nr:hypothetical protein [Bacteroidales bacterium]
MLTIRHRRHLLEPRLPHFIFIDGHYAATMTGDEIKFQIPAGTYTLRIQCGGRIPLRMLNWLLNKMQRNRLVHKNISLDLSVSTTAPLQIDRSQTDKTVTFRDREWLWNILFDIDLIVWIVSLFYTFPPLYKIISDTFFAIWLIRLIIIRKRYYNITIN